MTLVQSSKLFKRFLKIIVFVYIYQLVKFGDLISCGSKDIFKTHPVSCANTHHGVTDLISHWMVEITILEYLEN